MAEGSNTKSLARLAGIAYLVIILFSSAGYATLTRLLAGNSDMVFARLVTSETPFRLALAASAIGFAAWVVLGILLYRLMSSAGRTSGLLMLVFVVAGVAVSLIALSHLLPLVRSASSGMGAGTLAPMVDRYNRLLLLAQVFSGLWLFPFGWLVLRSRVAPRFLGCCLIVGGFGYLLVFATAFEPGLAQMTAYRIVSAALGITALVGEFGTCLWLLWRPGAPNPKTSPVSP
jgi:hypothetical protein